MKPSLPTVDWHEIYENYPKAWKVFWNWIISYDEICAFDIEQLENRIKVLGGCNFIEFTHFNRGDLYSFFDQKQIYLTTQVQPDHEWTFSIDLDLDCTFDNISYNERKDAEQAGFLEAFKILNNSIKDENKN